MTRPKLYPKSTRVRLTEEEHSHISESANRAGLSISRYLIESALKEVMTPEDKEYREHKFFQLDWAINEVARVGNNVNQIARQLNSQRGSINSESIRTALVAVTEALHDLHRLWARL